MIEQLCASRQAYDHYKICLKTVATSQQVSLFNLLENVEQNSRKYFMKNIGTYLSIFRKFSPKIQNSSVILVSKIHSSGNLMHFGIHVRDSCGDDALTYSFAAMNDYARMIDGKCRVNIAVDHIARNNRY
ncbi:unnamed protein product [Strongylus vulgaris]|uniref:Uncharacterized protein n=1 Tax=Strongylus vulgaris TaxID=40348 RepID=A0A3P7LKZ7_STRVU|nr:unnamed protein product [Strongylus vulgaris]